ncbi:hypothetical protein EYR38_003142 [Pleurotus pulmonarius]|nr:hypothetical protein EYR38_003142 [Pleurotus pulmonarius]
MSHHDLAVLLDGADPSVVYGPGWNQISKPQSNFIGGSAMEGSGNLAFNVSFYGVSLSAIGVINTTTNPFASIDNNTVQGGYLDLPNYRPWYTSPVLSDRQHNLSFFIPNALYAMLDYLVVTAGPSTPLLGKTIIADDFDADIQYKGSWETDFGQIFPARDSNSTGRLSYRNTTHFTRHPGSSFSFDFTGPTVSVYCILQSHLAGRLGAKFSIDGSSPTTYAAEFNNSTMRSFDRTHTQFFNGTVSAGTHRLDVEVTEVTGDQSFMLDYILYEASYENALSKPAANPRTEEEGSSKLPFGVTAGVIAAAIVLLILLVAFCWRRKRRAKSVEVEQGAIDLTAQHPAFGQDTPEMAHRGTFYRKSSFGISSQTLTTLLRVSKCTPGNDDIHRIDPFTISSSRPSSPHRRKKSEFLASIDTTNRHYPNASTSSGFHLPSPSSYHASQSSSDVTSSGLLAASAPSSPHHLTHASSRSMSSRRSKSITDPDSLDSLPRPPSSHTPSHSKHNRTLTSATNTSTYTTAASNPPSSIAHNHSRNSSHMSFNYPGGPIPQVELRRRTQEIYEMVARLESDITLAAAGGANGGEGEHRVQELRRRVEILTRENARLHNQSTMNASLPTIITTVEEPPPAYHTPGPATC